ncbi:MAG: hypothetical protein Q7R34_03005, partial [Dehalococcoidia bacterium]|nr:hypothetical protein [Dehalococcoidia bacterium]
MKKYLILVISFLIALSFVSSACTPQAQPTSPPAPASVPTSNLPLPTSQSPTAQDAAWQKVVEAAQKEGKLVLYSFSFTGDMGVQLAATF